MKQLPHEARHYKQGVMAGFITAMVERYKLGLVRCPKR